MSLFFKGVGWNIEGKLRKNLRPMKLSLPMLKWGKRGKKIKKKLETSFMDSPGISSKNNQLTWIVSKFVLCGVFFFQVLFVKIILKMMWLRTDYFFFPLHQHLHHREPLLKDYYSQINLQHFLPLKFGTGSSPLTQFSNNKVLYLNNTVFLNWTSVLCF